MISLDTALKLFAGSFAGILAIVYYGLKLYFIKGFRDEIKGIRKCLEK